MSNELIINSTQNGDRIVLLQDKKIVEYHVEQRNNNFTVGDIYLGVIRKVVPGLNAVFVDVGYEKDAFLHYLDLSPNFNSLNKFVKDVINKKPVNYRLQGFKMEPEIEKTGKITQIFSKNNLVLAQIIKEPISTKGPRLSCEISLAGRYLVLVPFSSSINISKKITNKEERQRLTRLMSAILPANFGVIVRTVAEGKEVAELDRDLRSLLDKWEQGMETLRNASPKQKIIGEMGRASSILRDLLNENFDNIIADDKNVYEEVKNYIRTIAPDKEKIVKLYNGKAKIFEHFGIEKQLKQLFGKSVSLSTGGYLIIEHTEALHVIDVNSGNKSNTETDQEETALKVNLEAVTEIARQLRVRDMGGIIIIDFIDMKRQENKKMIYDRMKQALKADRSKSTVLPLTKFGLMQITRQRVRPETNIITKETCPTCRGTGTIQASILISDTIEHHLEYILTKQNESRITMVLHPYLHAFFTKGWFSKQWRWFWKYKKWIKLVSDSSLGINEYKFINAQGEEIEVQSN
ncbi:MAG: Rne/Rng family ribonuclease [Microscillaceae bacterium]|nr:Rne/Rng family ribonuclease [Microscillaceae bacterium]MDW8461367.1 Rne/Rng family ribonuclease [Cytophagales bacterium]